MIAVFCAWWVQETADMVKSFVNDLAVFTSFSINGCSAPFQGKYDLDVVNSLFNVFRLLSSVFTLMFSVAPLVKLMLCFLLWLASLLCHGEIKGFHWKICRCIVVLFYLFKTKQNINSNWTLGSCVSENLMFHLKHFCCIYLLLFFFTFLAVYQNILVCINTLHLFMLYTFIQTFQYLYVGCKLKFCL